MGTVITKRNIFQRFFQSAIAIFIGVLLIIGMFALAIWSETRENPANVAKNAKEVTIQTMDDVEYYDGDFVVFKGTVMANGTLEDNGLKNSDEYVYIYRYEWVYAYVQHSTSSTSTGVGGTETTVTTYTYQLEWTTDVKTSFPNDTGVDTNATRALAITENNRILNTQGAPQSTAKYNSLITMDAVAITDDIAFDNASMIVPALTDVGFGFVLSTDNCIYKHQEAGTLKAGDLRVSYYGVKSGTEGIAIGKLDSGTLVDFTSKRDTKIGMFLTDINSKTELLNYLNKQNSGRLMIFRIIVIIGMMLAFVLITSPITTLLSVIPFLGKAGKVIQVILAAILGLAFGFVAILIGMFIRYWFITVPILAAIIILLIVLGVKKRNKDLDKA